MRTVRLAALSPTHTNIHVGINAGEGFAHEAPPARWYKVCDEESGGMGRSDADRRAATLAQGLLFRGVGLSLIGARFRARWLSFVHRDMCGMDTHTRTR